MAEPLGSVDIVILVICMAITALIGLYFTNKNKSMEAYMLGDRQQSLIPVAISLMTSGTSTLTLLGSSAEFFYQGPSDSFRVVPLLLAGPITAYTVLPIFYRLNELSLYQYLNRRYGLMIKYFVTVIFIIQMLLYNALVLYLPALALQTLFNISKYYSIFIIGLTGVIYTGTGGLKAVVWTDLFQSLMMYGCIFLVGFIGTLDAGGVDQVFSNAYEGGRFNLDGFFEFDLTTRHTWFGVMVSLTLAAVYLFGVNQVQMQRALSLPSLKQAQYSFILSSLFVASILLFSTYLGLVLYSAYGSCDPYLGEQIARRDLIIVYYVANRLSLIPGSRGLFVAGIFSATLSTLSSFANSMSALALEDFIIPLRRKLNPKNPELDDRTCTWLAKLIATGFGIVCVMIAFLIDQSNSRLLQFAATMMGAIGVPFLGAFALGIYTRFANTVGLLAGFAVTLPLGTYITLQQAFLMPPLEPTQQLYYNDQCSAVFNMTMSAHGLQPPIDGISNGLSNHPPTETPMAAFNVAQISYTMLPIIQFVLMIFVASIVSVLTGGLSQKVDENCLASNLLHSTEAGENRLKSGQKINQTE